MDQILEKSNIQDGSVKKEVRGVWGLWIPQVQFKSANAIKALRQPGKWKI